MDRHFNIRLNHKFPSTKSSIWSFWYKNKRMCSLTSGQCVAKTTKTGRRCRNISSMPFGICSQHLKLYGLRTGRTNLRIRRCRLDMPGLFAYRRDLPDTAIVFRTGANIAPIFGRRISSKMVDTLYGADDDDVAPYAVMGEKSLVVDGACIRSSGSFSNTCTSQNENCTTNAELAPERGGLFPVIRATRNILNHQEILTNYGDDRLVTDSPQHNTRPTRRLLRLGQKPTKKKRAARK